jgi:invasion protein IalB
MDHPDKSARTLGGIFAAIAAAAVLAVATVAIAQTPPATNPPKPPAAKKPPKQPPPQTQQTPPPSTQQQAQQPPVVVPQLIYRRWTKVCQSKDANPAPGGKQPCFIFMEGREDMGALVVRATIMEVDGEAKKGMVISFIYGVDLLRGTHIVVDQGPLEATAPYIVCVPPNVPPPLFGCISQYEITGEVINGMKKGKFLTVQSIFNGQTLSPQLPLADFAKAYDGPPTDLKAEAELEKRLQEELASRAKAKADEIAKKQPAKP